MIWYVASCVVVQDSFSEIARLLTDFFRDLDLVPTDIVAGLVLLRKQQKKLQETLVTQVKKRTNFRSLLTSKHPTSAVHARPIPGGRLLIDWIGLVQPRTYVTTLFVLDHGQYNEQLGSFNTSIN